MLVRSQAVIGARENDTTKVKPVDEVDWPCKLTSSDIHAKVVIVQNEPKVQFGLTTRMCSSRSCIGVASDGAVIIGNSPPKIAVNIGILRSLSRESVSAITSNNPIGFYGCQPVTPIRHLRAQNSGIARGKDWDVTCRHHNV